MKEKNKGSDKHQYSFLNFLNHTFSLMHRLAAKCLKQIKRYFYVTVGKLIAPCPFKNNLASFSMSPFDKKNTNLEQKPHTWWNKANKLGLHQIKV